MSFFKDEIDCDIHIVVSDKEEKIRFDEPEKCYREEPHVNRTGTYVAFDGQGSTDPTESDIHYFNLLKAWNKSGSIDFRFTNSHEKTYQVRDSSSKATLFNRLETRLSASKNFSSDYIG